MEKKACLKCCNYINSDNEAGTNKDGSVNYDYCRNCYQNGKMIGGIKINGSEVLIGVLLIIPLYAIIHIFNCLTGEKSGNYELLLVTCRILTIIFGVVLSTITNQKKSRPLFGLVIILMSLLSFYLYYDAEFVEHQGWDGLGKSLGFIAEAILLRIVSFIYFGKLFGKKKALSFLVYYIIFMALSLVTIVFINMN